jgi:hypothetical protein
LWDDLGPLADTEAAEAVLAGTYDIPDHIDPFAKLLLNEFRMPSHVTPLKVEDLEWTPKDLERAWRKQRLNTSAEPTGLSFAHLIVGSTDPSIAGVDAVLHNLPFQLGFSPKSWQIITDVAILKSPGVYDVEKMRTIMLLDTYYNMNNKRLGKLMAQQSEKFGLLPAEQYGGRNNHNCPDLGFNKVLIYDISRLLRWAIAQDAFDNSQCYDRIHHIPSTLAARSNGIPKEPLRSTVATFQESTHHIATAYGVSTQTYGGPQLRAKGKKPPQGPGQGSAHGPTSHNDTFAKPVQVMRRLGLALQFVACLTLTVLTLAMLQFVDDSDALISGASPDSKGEELPSIAQKAADVWEGCLYATGGAINHAKSCWYLLDYKWTGSSWVYRKAAEVPGSVMVRDIDEQRKPLLRKEASEATKSLGMYPAPDGNTKAQTLYLRDRGLAYSRRLRGRVKNRKNDVWITTQTTIMKTFEYPMRAICLKRREWKDVMAPVLQSALPASGFSRSFPQAVLYGPTEFQGMGMMDPWVHQELRHLEVLWEKTVSMDVSGQLLAQAMEAFRMELGTPDDITDHDYNLFQQCTSPCWIKTLWKSCQEFKIAFDDPFYKPKLQRTGDTFLMHAFVEQGFNPQELATLNQCRMFLKAITLADICTADGKNLHILSYTGGKAREPHLHRYNWARQPPSLSPDHWALWRQALDNFRTDTFNTFDLSLHHPLGAWLEDPNPIWPWIHNTTTDTLYHREGHLYQEFSPTSLRVTRNATYSKVDRDDWTDPATTPVSTLPPGDYRLVDVHRFRDHTRCTITSSFTNQWTSPTVANTPPPPWLRPSPNYQNRSAGQWKPWYRQTRGRRWLWTSSTALQWPSVTAPTRRTTAPQPSFLKV